MAVVMKRGLEMILGPMFAGKSTELIKRLRQHGHAMQRVCCIKYSGDTRYTEKAVIETHSAETKYDTNVFVVSRLADVSLDTIRGFDVIGVDEFQFFPDLQEVLIDQWLRKECKYIIVAGLNASFQETLLGHPEVLLPHVTKVDFLSAVCFECHEMDATRSYLIGAKKDTAAGELIGGLERYQALCTRCYDKKMRA